MLDVEALREQLQTLDFASPVEPGAAIKAYFRYYGLDFEARIASLEHYFGLLQIDESAIACHWYRQPGATACCVVVHGYFDHAGLYGKVIEFFLQAGRNVIAFDLPGHGLSSGPRASIEAFRDYELCLAGVIAQSSAADPKVIELVGQSTGGAVIMQYLLDKAYAPAAPPANVVLLAPLVRPVRWPILQLLFKLRRHWVSDIPRRFSSNSHDPEFLDFLRHKDPLQFRRLPLQWVNAMHRWIPRFLASEPSSTQALVIQGEQDGTVDWRYNIKQIRMKFPQAHIRLLPQGRHHLANESAEIRGQLFDEVSAYLQRESSGST